MRLWAWVFFRSSCGLLERFASEIFEERLTARATRQYRRLLRERVEIATSVNFLGTGVMRHAWDTSKKIISALTQGWQVLYGRTSRQRVRSVLNTRLGIWRSPQEMQGIASPLMLGNLRRCQRNICHRTFHIVKVGFSV